MSGFDRNRESTYDQGVAAGIHIGLWQVRDWLAKAGYTDAGGAVERMLASSAKPGRLTTTTQLAEPELSPPRVDDTLLTPIDRGTAKLSGYTGDICTNCNGVRMRRNGACLICDDCFVTTGCS